jgi:TonB family protein
MKRSFAQAVLLVCICTFSSRISQGQGGRRVDSPSKVELSKSSPAKAKKGGSRRKPGVSQPAVASLTVIVNPSDSTLLLNGQQVEGPTVNGLKPGPYILIVRHRGYRDDLRAITLVRGENPTITVTLEPNRGTLNVTPSIDGTVINIQEVGLSSEEGKRRHVGVVEKLQLPPGDYELIVSKEGYKSVARKFHLEAGGTVFLEPQLQILPPVQPPILEAKERAPLSPAELFEPALARKKILPAYSAAARASNITGLVIVSVLIDTKGDVKSAKAIEGPILLRQAAENAAKQWKFDPARRNGRPVQDTQQIRFIFQR